ATSSISQVLFLKAIGAHRTFGRENEACGNGQLPQTCRRQGRVRTGHAMKVYQKIASLDLFPPYRKPGIDGKKQESACQRSLALRKPKRLAALSQS
ncbi:hypothetical protein, partial [Desulfuromonas sp.]|uniref:hypothetical protein n=1 Tax=Desulfuromonas sp. TaxID=892 RepID=UPI0025C446ED